MSGPADLLFFALRRHMSKVNLFRWEAREVSVPRLAILIGSGSGGSALNVCRGALAWKGGVQARWLGTDWAFSSLCEKSTPSRIRLASVTIPCMGCWIADINLVPVSAACEPALNTCLCPLTTLLLYFDNIIVDSTKFGFFGRCAYFKCARCFNLQFDTI